MRTVIGGVGYRNLRDHSLGIMMSDELEAQAEPPGLLVEDLSYGPVAIGQWLLDEAREAPITRAVFVSAVARDDGRPPGTICAYRWDRVLPPTDEIQRCVTDAVTGVILLDNTLIVTAWMGALPDEAIILEVEPLEHAFGDDTGNRRGDISVGNFQVSQPIGGSCVLQVVLDLVDVVGADQLLRGELA